MCGVVEVFCFDKTGTLTEEGLDLKCLIPCTRALISPHKEFKSPPPDVLSTPFHVMNSKTKKLLKMDSVFDSPPPTTTFPTSTTSTPIDSKAIASKITSLPNNTITSPTSPNHIAPSSTPSCSTTVPDSNPPHHPFRSTNLDSTLIEDSPNR